MRRLVYAPKVFVFIRSHNMGGKIYNISNDVVSGSVQRNVNDLSKCSVQFRNTNYKYTRDPKTKRNIFLPMDIITVWLQRIAGRPIQVFTGYLDKAPYLQLYPGVAHVEASCTLKRLAYTWFDPGLEFFRSWVQSVGGWVVNPADGSAFNPEAMTQQVPVQPGTPPRGGGSVNDTSFGRLLYEFMVYIAGWNRKDIVISDIDSELPKKAAAIFRSVNTQTKEDLDALTEFFSTQMGVHIEQNPDGTNSDGTLPSNVEQTMRSIKQNQGGIPLQILVAAAHALSEFTPTYERRLNEDGGAGFGFGIYALVPGKDTGPVSDMKNVSKATQVFVRKLNAALDEILRPPPGMAASWWSNAIARKRRKQDFIKRATTNMGEAMQWIEEASGHKIDPNVAMASWETARRYVTALNNPTAAANMPSTTVVTKIPKSLDWDSPEIIELLDAKEQEILRNVYKGSGSIKELVPYLWWAKQVSKKETGTLKLSYRSNQNTDSIYIKASNNKIGRKFFDSFEGHKEVPRVTWVPKDDGGRLMVKGAVASNLTATEAERSMPHQHIRILAKEGQSPPDWVNLPTALRSTGETELVEEESGGTSDQLENGLTFPQLAAFSANAAFAARFAFPSDIIESHFLTGDKALMNDISCLDGVRQFCQASMRNFMSLPDGRFLAFYPDYFGAKRKPYWSIYDIEIVDMGIQLNDESLATHIFTTGDMIGSDGSVDFLDRIASRGVVTIRQAGIVDSFVNDINMNKNFATTRKLGRLADAYAFLQHYGARPYKEDMPLIRNASFEFLMSYQKFMQLWAQQFATNVEFTFQPEVMAGGLIAFPQHGFQMYVESVNHTFDYASGFDTSATLSSPALIAETRDKFKTDFPGFALAGGTITVGA